MQADHRPVLVTGATGYVGSRLAPRLLEKGYRVRAMVRSAAKLQNRRWAGHANLEVVEADVMDPESLGPAMRGCGAVYYLIHSMNPATKDFAAADRDAARNMVHAAQDGGVERIIYLGGIVPQNEELSHHLKSRADVGEILDMGSPALTSLHAAQLLGAGSASFELIRYLTERLPVMITPRWVTSECQPIAIGDALAYLIGCLEHDETADESYDIGGPDILTYAELFQLYAEVAGLARRTIIPVPVLTPALSSHWVGLVTPVPPSLAKPLILGLRNRVVCSENRIREVIPLELSTCREAIRRALDRVQQSRTDACDADVGRLPLPEWPACGDVHYSGGAVVEHGYTVRLRAEPMEVWPHLTAVGGRSGWFAGDGLWKLRGMADRLVGGVGLRRVQSDMHTLQPGDALDFWRVLDVTQGERLLLLAEMATPGDALLEFTLTRPAEGETEVRMLSRFLPRGAGGLTYGVATFPFDAYVFKGMLEQIARRTGKEVLGGVVKAE